MKVYMITDDEFILLRRLTPASRRDVIESSYWVKTKVITIFDGTQYVTLDNVDHFVFMESGMPYIIVE